DDVPAPFEIGPALVPAAAGSYRELLSGPASSGLRHDVVLVVALDPRRAGHQARGFGRGEEAACGLLRRELRLLRGQLRAAELDPGPPLTPAGLAATLRRSVEPAAGVRRPAGATDFSGRQAGSGRDPSSCREPGSARHAASGRDAGAWPVAWRESWSALQADGHWHATYWIAEWPRTEVGPAFLTPLLLAGATRTVSVTMAPVPPHQAARQVESARTAELADAELRRRAGFVQTARHVRRAEGVAVREAELADGHGELRFSGYVRASGRSEAELDAACAAVETAAHQSGLELRRLYGQQADAFVWTLPVGRGLV
ncbi:MAG TPA: SCO6880 family protein, partial [Acidimicrobiales bacterium]|nr:SCO6880 family protein [Acidimicrobiales bacterium]